jgi:hypothetical protein
LHDADIFNQLQQDCWPSSVKSVGMDGILSRVNAISATFMVDPDL